jgi:hypothetical protein
MNQPTREDDDLINIKFNYTEEEKRAKNFAFSCMEKLSDDVHPCSAIWFTNQIEAAYLDAIKHERERIITDYDHKYQALEEKLHDYQTRCMELQAIVDLHNARKWTPLEAPITPGDAE